MTDLSKAKFHLQRSEDWNDLQALQKTVRIILSYLEDERNHQTFLQWEENQKKLQQEQTLKTQLEDLGRMYDGP